MGVCVYIYIYIYIHICIYIYIYRGYSESVRIVKFEKAGFALLPDATYVSADAWENLRFTIPPLQLVSIISIFEFSI